MQYDMRKSRRYGRYGKDGKEEGLSKIGNCCSPKREPRRAETLQQHPFARLVVVDDTPSTRSEVVKMAADDVKRSSPSSM